MDSAHPFNSAPIRVRKILVTPSGETLQSKSLFTGCLSMKFASRQKAEYLNARSDSFGGCLRLTIGLVVVFTVASILWLSPRLAYAAGATDTASAPATA